MDRDGGDFVYLTFERKNNWILNGFDNEKSIDFALCTIPNTNCGLTNISKACGNTCSCRIPKHIRRQYEYTSVYSFLS